MSKKKPEPKSIWRLILERLFCAVKPEPTPPMYEDIVDPVRKVIEELQHSKKLNMEEAAEENAKVLTHLNRREELKRKALRDQKAIEKLGAVFGK